MQPKPFAFEKIISKLSPRNYFVQFSSKLHGFRIASTDQVDEIRRDVLRAKVITYIFLLKILSQNQLISLWEQVHNETYDGEVNVLDNEGNNLNDLITNENRLNYSDGFAGATLWETITKYGGKIILPNYSLMKYIENNFKTDDQINADKNISKASRGLLYSLIAILISTIALIFSVLINVGNTKATKEMNRVLNELLIIERQELIFQKDSLNKTLMLHNHLTVDSMKHKTTK